MKKRGGLGAVFLPDRADSVDRVGFARALDFNVGESELGGVLDGELDHAVPVRGCGQRAWLFVRGITGRDEQDSIQL
jgi:hypothetical protein